MHPGIPPLKPEYIHMSQEVETVLECLHAKKEIDGASTQTALAKTIAVITNGLRWVGGGGFLLLCALALMVRLSHSSNELWLTVALSLAVIQSTAALAWMILDTIPSAIFLLLFRSHMFRQGLLEMAHDFAHAEDLRRFDLASLKQAEQWLSIRIDRMKSRLIFGVGGSDKVAVIAMVAGAWAVWNNFPKAGMEWMQQTYLIGSAALGGLAIGAMFANALIRQWSYQKELLAIAIFQLENE
jgi:hypothetical protein